MGGLFSSLQTASSALDVFSRALGVDQTNVSNASTAGYAAQRANILPIGGSGDGSGTGDFVTVSSNGNSRADAIVQAATSQASASQTQANQLSPINQLFDITGSSGILAAFQQFSSAFSSLSLTPNDPTLGANALTAAGNAAAAFRTVASSLDTQRGQVDSSIQSVTAQINTLGSQIRQLNVQAANESTIDPSTDASLRSALDSLSSLADISVSKSPNGGVSVLIGGQLPLVQGDQAYTISTDPTAAAGSQVTSSAGGSSPASFSGQLGALLQTRNGTLDQLLGANGNPGTLNTLAAGFAARVNTLLSSGVTSNGSAGTPIFTWDQTDPTNAARTLAVDPSVTASQLGLGLAGPPAQSNAVANQLGALTGSANAADQIGGLSADDYFSSVAASVGQQLSDARNASTDDQTALTTAQNNRQQESGVSLDQEAANITAYERSYQANAQVVSILNQLTADTVNLISGTTSA